MIIRADSLSQFPLPDASVQCCITSPPYWGLRDYGVDGQLGLEATPEEYVERLVGVFREVWRVLRDDGTVWLNLGDSYCAQPAGNKKDKPSGFQQNSRAGQSGSLAQYGHSVKWKKPSGLKPKDLVGIPWRVAFALQADGWYLRSDIIWSKPNPMPESVTDRPTKAHEYVFLLSKSAKYFYDAEAIKEEGSMLARDQIDARVARARTDGKSMPTTMKNGIRPKQDKQRGHGRRHAGFNDRWDALSKEEQCSVGRNKRSVWTIATTPTPEAHFAAFPEALVEPCVLAGSAQGDLVLDPFGGTGTTVKVAQRLGRKAVALEISPEYCRMAHAKTWQSDRQTQMPAK